MPVQSVLPSPADPQPSAPKEELPIEPVKPDPPAGPTETTDGADVGQNSVSIMPDSVPAETSVSSSDSSDVEQGSVPMMAAQTVPSESSVSPLDSADLEQGSVPMEIPTVPAESSVPFSDSSDVEQKSAPMTHSVQVGAFRRTENADDLIAQLAVKGYSAQIVEIPDSQGRLWFTVRIGDHPTFESAEKQAGIFMEAENVKAYVRPYNAF
jgi:cell division protein FtsN